jgi:hypothetical protein
MLDVTDWLPPAAVGTCFTFVGLCKVYGLSRAIVGGGCKPASQRLCGSCPTWSRGVNYVMIVVLLAIGLGNLAYLTWLIRH